MSGVPSIRGDALSVILILLVFVVFTLLFIIRFAFIGPDLVILATRFAVVELVEHLDRDVRRRHASFLVVDTAAIVSLQTVRLLLLVTTALL